MLVWLTSELVAAAALRVVFAFDSRHGLHGKPVFALQPISLKMVDALLLFTQAHRVTLGTTIDIEQRRIIPDGL